MSRIIINGHNFVKSLLDGQRYGETLVHEINAYLAYLAEQAEISGITLEVDNSDQGEGVYRVESSDQADDAAAAHDFMRHRAQDFWSWHGQRAAPR